MGIEAILDMAAEAHPDRVAIGGATDGLTYQRLRLRAIEAAARIHESGAQSVVFIGVSGPALPVALFAAAGAGLPFTPLNYRLSATQLEALLAELPAPYILTDPAFAAILAGSPAVVASTETWPERGAGLSSTWPVTSTEDAPAVVLFTSGTTSAPKGVRLRHANLLSYVFQTVEFASADTQEAALVSVPPYHIAGVGTVLTNVFAGRRLVYLPNFDAPSWIDTVRRERITNAMVVPTMLTRVVRELGARKLAFPHLRSLAYGGAPIARSVLEAAVQALPGVDFVNAYGLTETSSTIALLGPDDHRAALASAEPRIARRLGSAGRLVPGIEGQIRDEAGVALGSNASGDLWVRGPQIAGEYVGLGSALDADGWFATRDRGWFDEEGYLYLEGRTDDTIIRGGENIAPAEIAQVLVEHPLLAEVAVLGVPDEEWGERIVAALVRAELPGALELTSADIKAWVRKRLRGSRTPDDVVWLRELPQTELGKVIGPQLREIVLDQLAASMREVTL
jgi:acyl-CoA synthetase (AMP-forming)/AMP-acid ligase II